MPLFRKERPFKILDGYLTIGDGYTESPLGHYENVSKYDQETEYFMQYVLPLKLHRVALRTPIGYRIVYLYAKDVWNNRLGILIPNEKEKTEAINKFLIPHLLKLNWFQEMEKITAFEKEQGEGILLCYYGDEGELGKYAIPVTDNDEILKVEAFSPLYYSIPRFDKYGEPALYRIEVKTPDNWRGTITVDVDPSRVLRKANGNFEFRYAGYPELSSVYDSIVIISTIIKACGEAAFRWGTGHPIFMTKNIFDDIDLEKLKKSLADVTRRSWHALPSEKIDRIEMLGQAGSMLNFKALAEICVDQVCAGTGIPRPILLGEVAGVISGSEVNERSFFSLLDKDHTELEPFCKIFFQKDLNIRKLLFGIQYYELDWGIREVLNKLDELTARQKAISNALAMTQVCTINESRREMGMESIEEDAGGDVILGLLPYMEMQWNMLMSQQQMEEGPPESETNTSMDEKARSTEKKAGSAKDLEKDKTITNPNRDSLIKNLKDALKNMRKEFSINELCDQLGIYDKTAYKLLRFADEK